MSYIVLMTLMFSVVFPCEGRCIWDGLWTKPNPAKFLVTGLILFATTGQFVVALPIQSVGVQEVFRGPAYCNPKKQYWDDVVSRCRECSLLCREERTLMSECREHCLAYILSQDESILTTKIITSTTVTSTERDQTESVKGRDYYFLVVIITITILLVAIFTLMLACLAFWIVRRKCGKPLPDVSSKYPGPNPDHIYTEDPTRQSEVPCKEAKRLLPCETSKSQQDRTGLSDTKEEETSQDSGIIIPGGSSFLQDSVDLLQRSQLQGELNEKSSGQMENSFDILNNDPHVGPKKSVRDRHSSDPLSNASQSFKSEHEVKGEQGELTQHKGTSEPKMSRISESEQRQQKTDEHDCHSKERRREETKSDEFPGGKRSSWSSSNPKAVSEDERDKPWLTDCVEDTSVYPSEPLLPPAKTEPKPYQKNKHIYDQLRKIPWVEGYYSEGKSIQVYVDLLNLEADWASKQLQLETGQSKDKFHVIHSAQLT